VAWNEWIRTVEVEPSLYAADFSQLGAQIDVLLRAGVRIFHFDVGDGHFVEPITIGPIVLQSISKQIHDGGGHIDCHLMTEMPEKHFRAIKEAGGDSVTVHFEACPDLTSVVNAARANELYVGLAFKPQTSPDHAAHAAIASRVDLVLCMSIEPGYSGQEFMPEAYERIHAARSILPTNVPVQVDGGIGPKNIRKVREAGASLFVAGSSIFGREDLPRAYRRLLDALADEE
jgi:ribulose-phosphate 3-epimerase